MVGAYPLQFVAERVGGDRVAVTNLTPPGAEPHDLELTPQDVARRQRRRPRRLPSPASSPRSTTPSRPRRRTPRSTSPSAGRVDLVAAEPTRHDDEGEHADEEHSPTTATTTAASTRTSGSTRPGWPTSPTRSPTGSPRSTPSTPPTIAANAADLRAELEHARRRARAGPRRPATARDLVTSHEAFGYLADRYDLHQVGISGLSPDAEPTPATLAEVADVVREHGVTTIYYETLVAPGIAETVAGETGAPTAVLDPIEGSPTTPTADYFAIMRANLAALEEGRGCS